MSLKSVHRPAISAACLTAILCLSVTVFSPASSTTPEPEPVPQDVKVFMRAKLKSCNRILKGLTSDDPQEVKFGVDELVAMSKKAMWHQKRTPVYVQDTADFVANVELLSLLTEQENMPAATLAFSQLMVRCNDCHSHVRVPKLAALPAPRATENLAALLDSTGE